MPDPNPEPDPNLNLILNPTLEPHLDHQKVRKMSSLHTKVLTRKASFQLFMGHEHFCYRFLKYLYVFIWVVYKDHFTVLSLQSLHCESLRSGLLQWWWTTWNTKKIILTSNILMPSLSFASRKVNIHFHLNSLPMVVMTTALMLNGGLVIYKTSHRRWCQRSGREG